MGIIIDRPGVGKEGDGGGSKVVQPKAKTSTGQADIKCIVLEQYLIGKSVNKVLNHVKWHIINSG